MKDGPSAAEKLGGLKGTDAGALGIGPPPESAPSTAEVVDEENLIPGADVGLHQASYE